jgi:hypothetical protein
VANSPYRPADDKWHPDRQAGSFWLGYHRSLRFVHLAMVAALVVAAASTRQWAFLVFAGIFGVVAAREFRLPPPPD